MDQTIWCTLGIHMTITGIKSEWRFEYDGCTWQDIEYCPLVQDKRPSEKIFFVFEIRLLAADDAVELGKPEKKKRSFAGFMDYVTPALFIGLIGAFIARAITGQGSTKAPEELDGAGVLSVSTLAVAVIFSIVLEVIVKKLKLTWLEPFVMPIGMIVAMISAIVLYNVLPNGIALIEWRG